jgi:threonine-phosphate decarboxylase
LQQLERFHGGNLNRASLKYGLPKEEIIDFSANINPLGPSKEVTTALKNNLDLISRYPDPDCNELKTALSFYLGVHEKNILMGNGAAELIYLFIRVAGFRQALIPVPTFSEYSLAVLSQGGEVLKINMHEKDGFNLPVDRIIDHFSPGKLLFLCNPNNPTGRVVNGRVMRLILKEALSRGVFVLVDEAFMDFMSYRNYFSVMSLAEKQPNLAVLYSMTKFFGIPGLRLGAMVANEELVEKMKIAKDPWNVNILAQVAGMAGLRDGVYMENTRRLVKRERKFLYRGLNGIAGLRPFPGAANFLLVKIVRAGMNSQELTDLIGRRGMLLRDCYGFSGLEGHFIRLAVKNRLENKKILLALKSVLEG